MGVAIIGYKNIRRDDESEDAIYIAGSDFVQGVKNGFYEASYGAIECFDSTCTFYNKWRESLFSVVSERPLKDYQENCEDYSTEPFHYLLHFADNGGAIDTEFCNKLFIDFKKYKKVAKEKLNQDDYEIYKLFKKALKTARHGGFLHFS